MTPATAVMFMMLAVQLVCCALIVWDSVRIVKRQGKILDTKRWIAIVIAFFTASLVEVIITHLYQEGIIKAV